MRKLIVLAVVGFFAQLIDGALGMAYGVTSSSLMLAAGLAPAAASASVHLAEIGTTLASGASHWRFGNVDWKIVLRLGVPGAIGAFAGATFLSSLTTESAKPVMAGILLCLGVYVLVRFTFGTLKKTDTQGVAPVSVPGPARAHRRIHRRIRRRRMGSGGHAHASGHRQGRTPQGHRFGGHERVPGGHRRQRRLPHRHRQRRSAPPVRGCAAHRRPDRGAHRRLPGPDHPGPVARFARWRVHRPHQLPHDPQRLRRHGWRGGCRVPGDRGPLGCRHRLVGEALPGQRRHHGRRPARWPRCRDGPERPDRRHLTATPPGVSRRGGLLRAAEPAHGLARVSREPQGGVAGGGEEVAEEAPRGHRCLGGVEQALEVATGHRLSGRLHGGVVADRVGSGLAPGVGHRVGVTGPQLAAAGHAGGNRIGEAERIDERDIEPSPDAGHAEGRVLRGRARARWPGQFDGHGLRRVLDVEVDVVAGAIGQESTGVEEDPGLFAEAHRVVPPEVRHHQGPLVVDGPALVERRRAPRAGRHHGPHGDECGARGGGVAARACGGGTWEEGHRRNGSDEGEHRDEPEPAVHVVAAHPDHVEPVHQCRRHDAGHGGALDPWHAWPQDDCRQQHDCRDDEPVGAGEVLEVADPAAPDGVPGVLRQGCVGDERPVVAHPEDLVDHGNGRPCDDPPHPPPPGLVFTVGVPVDEQQQAEPEADRIEGHLRSDQWAEADQDVAAEQSRVAAEAEFSPPLGTDRRGQRGEGSADPAPGEARLEARRGEVPEGRQGEGDQDPDRNPPHPIGAGLRRRPQRDGADQQEDRARHRQRDAGDDGEPLVGDEAAGQEAQDHE